MNVLLSAYACAPLRGSEPQIGWNWAREIAGAHPVWILTRRKHQRAIERELRSKPLPNAHFVYLDLPGWARFWKDLPGGVYLYYLIWQALAYFRAKSLHKAIHFDATHHVTFCMFWMPSFLPLLGVPFIWGPLGGGESMPAAFRAELPLRNRVFESARDLARRAGCLNPFVRLAARRSSIALAGTPETAAQLRKLGCHDVQILPVAAITAEELAEFDPPPFRPRDRAGVLHVFSAGRLLHWKGNHLTLRAIARIRDRVPVEYWIFGEGPERSGLQRLARSLGIEDRVHFMGGVSRQDLLQEMPSFDLLMHPSLHDSGGFVCAEAMAFACPVLCLDMGGPAVMALPDTELTIHADTPEGAVRRIVSVLERLHQNPMLASGLRADSRRHAVKVLALSRQFEKLSIYTRTCAEVESS